MVGADRAAVNGGGTFLSPKWQGGSLRSLHQGTRIRGQECPRSVGPRRSLRLSGRKDPSYNWGRPRPRFGGAAGTGMSPLPLTAEDLGFDVMIHRIGRIALGVKAHETALGSLGIDQFTLIGLDIGFVLSAA